MWQKTKTGGKAGFDKLWGWADKLGAPVNRLSNKLGSEAFWPTTLDKESDKAARILRSFCKDGFYEEEVQQPAEGPKQKQKVLKKIPADVIRNAKGLAIFTTMRTGLWVSGAGGSGVLVGRKEDGTWSPPSGIMLHTAGLGFLIGVDIYDCVVVINTTEALEAFSKVRCTLGGEVSAVAGPVGIGGVLDTEVHKRQAPIFTYLKSRGFYAGVQIDGTIVIERTDENERFYNERIPVGDILAGKVRHVPYECRKLLETIKAAQGDTDVDPELLPSEPPPADYEIESNEHIFGIPDREDPDPFGVLALEQAGLEIREAGTHARASSEQFEFRPTPSSPIYSTFSRRSMDSKSISRRSSWRTSTLSSIDRATQMTDMSTQTDFDDLPAASTPSPKLSDNGRLKMDEIPEDRSTDDKADEETPKEEKRVEKKDSTHEMVPNGAGADQADDNDDDDDSDDDEEPVIIEEPVVQEVKRTTSPQGINRARIVTVAKPNPPKLPPRNPTRRSRADPMTDAEHTDSDQSSHRASPITPHAPSRPSLSQLPGPKIVSESSVSSGNSDDEAMGVRMANLKVKNVEQEPVSPEETKNSYASVSHTPARSSSPEKGKGTLPGAFP